MAISVTYLERRSADTPSIERLFQRIAEEVEKLGISSRFIKVSGDNGFTGMLKNLAIGAPDNGGIFHITGHINYLALRLPRNRTVLTIHDTTVLEKRTGLRRWLISKLYFEWPIRRLKYVTAISEQTRSDLIQITGIEPDRIRVIENPLIVAISDKPKVKQRRYPVILQIGTAPNKNISRTIEALREMPCSLRIVGKIDAGLKEELRSLNRWINVSDLNDTEIISEYDSADVLTFCSTKEGFGLPILEAQARGLPVVTSDLEPMRSVAGHGALCVDPYDAQAIRYAVQRILTDPVLRGELVAAGFENIKRFQAGHISKQYFDLYESIVESEKLSII